MQSVPDILTMGAGEVGNGSCVNPICDAYQGMLGKDDGLDAYNKNWMSNPSYDYYAGWGALKERGKTEGKQRYTIKPYDETGSGDHMVRPGDSGGGILATDPNTNDYKLISRIIR